MTVLVTGPVTAEPVTTGAASAAIGKHNAVAA